MNSVYDKVLEILWEVTGYQRLKRVEASLQGKKGKGSPFRMTRDTAKKKLERVRSRLAQWDKENVARQLEKQQAEEKAVSTERNPAYERMTELLWEESMKRIVRRISSLQRKGVSENDPRIQSLRSRQRSKAGSSNPRYEERKKAVAEGKLRLKRQIKALSARKKALPAEDVEGVIGAHQTERSKEARLKYKEKAGSERRLSKKNTKLAKGRAAAAGLAIRDLLGGKEA